MNNKIIGILIFLSAIVLLSACRTSNPRTLNKQFNYFQRNLDSNRRIVIKPLVVVSNDQLSIQVVSSTMNQDQVSIFNSTNSGIAPVGNTISGLAGGASAATTQNQQLAAATMGYLVDSAGNINFPLLGKIPVNGKTRAEIAEMITNLLSDKGFVKDPVVQVRFLQLKVNVMGEVKIPGTKTFTSDRITIIDALSASGDLTDFGRRDNITVIREKNGIQKVMRVNIMDANFMSSEAYQLQQNDVVYVYANTNKLKETGFDPKQTHDLQIWAGMVSLLSFALTVVLLFK